VDGVRGSLVLLIAACGSHGTTTTTADAPVHVAGDDGGDDDSCSAIPAAESGDGTYYDADGTGNCSFDASTDYMVAAMNAPDYGTAQWCGACLAVTGPMGNTITVRVVDQCPGCSHGDLDLSETAFGMLAPTSAGRISITWHEVPCDVTGPVGYNFQMGASQYYVAIQIRNSLYPVQTLEAKQGSAYTMLAKQTYNYYVASDGLGVGPFDLRVTDERGQVIEDTGIALGNDDTTEDGSSQFPRCAGD
jgi:expansin (peptidoglycan-binding protein)